MERLLKFKTIKLAVTLCLLLTIITYSKAQIAYSPYVDSIQQLIDTTNLKLIIRQLSGDTSATINGQDTVIFTRVLDHPHNALAAEYIRERFEEYGYSPETQFFNEGMGENIIVTKTGNVYPNKKYIICAHYDSHCFDSIRAPGADDNASGTAAVLEISRILLDIPLEYTVQFIAWDEEETGLHGSEFYASQAVVNGDSIVGVVNLDMLGYDSDNDGFYMITWDSLSYDFAKDFETASSQYFPGLHNIRGDSGSDHLSFMERGYTAIGIAEDEVNDFNPFYHRVTDIIYNLNLPYYFSMVKASAVFLVSKALDYEFEIFHDLLQSGNYTMPVRTSIAITGHPIPIAGEDITRLYYSVDGTNYDYLTPCEVVSDTFKFILPEFPLETWVSYYFATQDTDGELMLTYPAGGLGFNPPGIIPPASPFTFYVDYLTNLKKCSENVPITLPALHTTYDTIIVSNNLPIFDLDVLIDITHGNTSNFEIEVIAPDNTSVLLCNSVHNGVNFSQTIFDDEAVLGIMEGTPPFTGRFRPIESLSVFDNQLMGGIWRLKVRQPNFNNSGILNEWCLHFIYHDTTTGLEEIEVNQMLLSQNYPNPATDYTNIEFTLKEPNNVSLYFTDISGRLVKSVLSGNYSSGNHLVVVSVKDLKPGVYFYSLKTQSGIYTKRIIKK